MLSPFYPGVRYLRAKRNLYARMLPKFFGRLTITFETLLTFNTFAYALASTKLVGHFAVKAAQPAVPERF